MKTIILSDIQGNSESIIPYGLRFGKHTGTEVEIVHTVDPRIAQGASSPYANSQSMTPGKMLSHEEIMQRERSKAQLALHKLISKEGSRLNYPLKIEIKMSEGSVKAMMNEVTTRYPGSIMIASNEPSDPMVENMDEMLEITGNMGLPTLFIPPDYKFTEPKAAMLLTDFKHTDYESFKEMIEWLIPFHSNVHAFGLAGSTEHLDMDMESTAWKKMVNTFIDHPMSIETNVIDDGQPLEEFVEYIERNGADFLLIPRFMLKGTDRSPVTKKSIKKMMKMLDLPVALF